MALAEHIQRAILLSGMVLLFSFGACTGARADLLVIANPQAQITSLDRNELKSIYLNDRSTWSNGIKIKPAMLGKEGPRQEFCQVFLNKSPSQLKRHWRRQLYIGKALPPPELATSAAVIHYVRTTPGALGFIVDTPRPEGVVVIRINP